MYACRSICICKDERIAAYRPVAKQWLCKQRPLLGNARNTYTTTIKSSVFCGTRRGRLWATARQTPSRGKGQQRNNRSAVFSIWSLPFRDVITRAAGAMSSNPCGGKVEYLHRDPASRRRRRKEKSQFWESKIWSRVPKDSDLRKTTLARVRTMYQRQTRSLVRENTPQKQDRNC
jgi:hypothetical protein